MPLSTWIQWNLRIMKNWESRCFLYYEVSAKMHQNNYKLTQYYVGQDSFKLVCLKNGNMISGAGFLSLRSDSREMLGYP